MSKYFYKKINCYTTYYKGGNSVEEISLPRHLVLDLGCIFLEFIGCLVNVLALVVDYFQLLVVYLHSLDVLLH